MTAEFVRPLKIAEKIREAFSLPIETTEYVKIVSDTLRQAGLTDAEMSYIEKTLTTCDRAVASFLIALGTKIRG